MISKIQLLILENPEAKKHDSDKSIEDVEEWLKSQLAYKVIQTDKGTEFFNVLVQTYLADNNIKLFATHSERKAQIVEILN